MVPPAYLFLLVRRKRIRDSRDGALAPRGVQRAEDEVAGFCGADGRLNGLQVT